jgi:hypothetical protein
MSTVIRLCVTVKQLMAKVASSAEGRLAVSIYFRKAKSMFKFRAE